MKLHIYYRHTPVARSAGKFRPAWFTHERCFLNLLDTVRAHLVAGTVHLTVVFDGTGQDLQNDFIPTHLVREGHANPSILDAVRTVRIDGGDQRKAWRACVNLVRHDVDDAIGKGDTIYLLENDYMHRPGWIEEVGALAEQGVEWDYLTLYDHPDKYPNHCSHPDAARYSALRVKLFATATRHWRTVPGTCATYMLSRETFLRDHVLLKQGIFDFNLFRILTRMKRRVVISPIPALSTHSMSGLLAPTVDWDEVIKGRP